MFKLRIHRHHALALDAGNIVPALTGLRPGAHFTSIVDIRVLLFMIEVVNINTGGLLLSFDSTATLLRELLPLRFLGGMDKLLDTHDYLLFLFLAKGEESTARWSFPCSSIRGHDEEKMPLGSRARGMHMKRKKCTNLYKTAQFS